jgi:hypothetical protein
MDWIVTLQRGIVSLVTVTQRSENEAPEEPRGPLGRLMRLFAASGVTFRGHHIVTSPVYPVQPESAEVRPARSPS